jgi:hypothetical protein
MGPIPRVQLSGLVSFLPQILHLSVFMVLPLYLYGDGRNYHKRIRFDVICAEWKEDSDWLP